MRRTSAGALGDIGRPTAQPAVDMLLKAFRGDSDPSVKRAVLAALVNVVGPETKKAAAELTTALKQMRENKEVVIVELRDVAFALANIGGRDALPAVPVLTEGLSDADPAQRQQSSELPWRVLANTPRTPFPSLAKFSTTTRTRMSAATPLWPWVASARKPSRPFPI